jgi:hypothetical protein
VWSPDGATLVAHCVGSLWRNTFISRRTSASFDQKTQ